MSKTVKSSEMPSWAKEIPRGWTVEVKAETPPKLSTDKGQSLQLNFHRVRKPSLKQALVRAIGFKGRAFSILDITAGWGQDAFLLSLCGCQVTALESNPFVFHFVKNSLEAHSTQRKRRDGINPASCERPSGNIQLIFADSLSYLKNIKTENRPDIIYMDPMFGGKKTRLSQKSIHILKEIVGPTANKQELFELALKKALKKVVVKRHRLEPSIGKNKPSVFKARSICYDVFRPSLTS